VSTISTAAPATTTTPITAKYANNV
jgi:hypothetical protein